MHPYPATVSTGRLLLVPTIVSFGRLIGRLPYRRLSLSSPVYAADGLKVLVKVRDTAVGTATGRSTLLARLGLGRNLRLNEA